MTPRADIGIYAVEAYLDDELVVERTDATRGEYTDTVLFVISCSGADVVVRFMDTGNEHRFGPSFLDAVRRGLYPSYVVSGGTHESTE